MGIPILRSVARALSLLSGSQKILNSGFPTRHSEVSLQAQAEIPGGSPLSFCEVSRSTDLFAITSIYVSQQPIYIDDDFLVLLEGTFQNSLTPNATFDLRVDCGSHCEEYGNPPGEVPSDTETLDFCMLSEIEQPLGGKKATCAAEKGYALITTFGYVWPMFLRTPGWYNFTFDAKTAEGERIYCVTTEVCLRWEDEEKNKHYPPGRWNDCRWPR